MLSQVENQKLFTTSRPGKYAFAVQCSSITIVTRDRFIVSYGIRLMTPGYTSGIYADGYIVFAFPFVRSYVRSLVCSFVIPERS